MQVTDYFLGSVAFALGCAAYTMDALYYQSPQSRLIIFGCVMFDVGCVFFIKDATVLMIRQ